MSNFKFKQKKDKFIWKNHDIKVVFSNPSMQGYNSYNYINKVDEIMYLYYSVSVYKRVIHSWKDKDDEPNYKWKLITSTHTHDFPTILQLQEILEIFINDKIDIKSIGEKHEYRSGAIRYSTTYFSEGFGCDDFYEITKYVGDNYDPSYIVYIGTSFSLNSDCNSIGIRTPYVYENDIKELYKCVNYFIQYIITSYNEEIKRRISFESSNKMIVNNKLYVYSNNEELESIFTIGDTFSDIDYLVYKDNLDFEEKELNYVKIKKIKKDSIVFQQSDKKEIELKLSSIMYLSDEISKEKLSYNKEEVAIDFLSILNQKEKDEFIKNTTSDLLKKYKNAIIDRTWMCRKEHNFEYENTGYPTEDIKPIVKDVIKLIKKYIQEEQNNEVS